MKIDQLIVQHLYQSKEVTLQGIGTFRLNPQVTLPSTDDKDFVMPADAIHFEYNLKATEDEALINYIVLHSRKIKPLATSDLDSYAMLAKQFLNIGKPLVIEGIGTVEKNQQGEYQFIPGNLISSKVEEAPNQFREKKEEAVSFRSARNPNDKNKRTIPASVLILSCSIIIGLCIFFYFLFKKTQPLVPVGESPITTVVPSKDSIAQKDTVDNTKTDSSLLKPVTISKDSFNFKIVIKEYSDSVLADKAFQRIKLTKYGNKIILYKTNSTYKIGIPFTTPLSDTTNEFDSIHKFFMGETHVEL